MFTGRKTGRQRQALVKVVYGQVDKDVDTDWDCDIRNTYKKHKQV